MLGMMPMAMSQMPTLGNPQAQQQQQEMSLAQVLQMYQQAQSQMERGQAMQGGEYIDNSGLLGVLASAFSSYKGAKMERKGREKVSEHYQKAFELQRREDAEKAKADFERQLALHRGKAGIDAEHRRPANSQPVWTNQGLVAFNPEQGTYSKARPAMQGHDGMQVQIDPSLPPEVQASIMANEGAWASKDAISGAGSSAPLMPHREPERAPAPPSGYRDAGGGRLEPIPGGPADKPVKPSLSTAQTAVDKAFAKDYVSFVQSGAADARKALDELGAAIKTLEDNDSITGPVVGALPDFIATRTGFADAVATREDVEQTVQRSLRAILGAQFTEKEGERLIRRAFNPNLDEATNAKRVKSLATQLERAYKGKVEAARYYEEHGTLAGFEGPIEFGTAGFNPDAEIAPAPDAAPTAPGKRLKFNPATGKIE